jgi:hypothetical protein
VEVGDCACTTSSCNQIAEAVATGGWLKDWKDKKQMLGTAPFGLTITGGRKRFDCGLRTKLGSFVWYLRNARHEGIVS